MQQWTPEYAAQILKIMNEGYGANPDIPSGPVADLVPMGAPQSLNPPQYPSSQDNEGEAAAYAALARPGLQSMDPTSQIPPGPTILPPAIPTAGVPPSVQPEGSQAPSVPGPTAVPQQELWKRIMLGTIAGLAGAVGDQSSVRNLHQTYQMMQGELGQKQLSTIRGNVAQITETQGPEAAKQYLVQTMGKGQFSPAVGQLLDKQLEEMNKRSLTRRLVIPRTGCRRWASCSR
jgi:hypothetical protein